MTPPSTTTRVIGLVLLGVAALSTAPAFAQGTTEQREACTPDAIRLCADTVPDVGRTTACMKSHFSELSPRCQTAFAGPPAAKTPATKTVAAKPLAPKARVARAPAPAPVAESAPPMMTHHRRMAVVAPATHRVARHPVSTRVAARGDHETREARRVIGHLCGSNVIDPGTCGFMGKMLTRSE